MSPYSRSAKVVMYLVASMTVATGLLLWMEHLVAPPGIGRAPREGAGPLRETLRTLRPIEPGSWGQIVISYRDRAASDPSVALAAGRSSPYHFVVESTGRIRALPTWREQEPDDGNAERDVRAIRICYAGQPGSDGISAEQWDALIGLLRQLRLRCQLPAKAVQLDPQSDPQFRPNISHQAHCLRQMLLDADVID